MRKYLLLISLALLIQFYSIAINAKGFFPKSENDSVKGKIVHTVRTYVTTRTNKAPQIDGILDDDCWKGEGWDNFTYQREPVDGGIPTEKTLFKVLFDENHIYAAAKCFDSSPEKISRILSSRDSFIGDMIGFCFDSYYDRRTSFEFCVSAAGAKVDNMVTNGNEIRMNWDPIWNVKVGSEDSAWTAEFEIPFSQLRFNDKDEHTWGFMVWRWIYRKSEENDWGPNPISASTWVDKYGDIKGIKGIKAPSRMEFLPYTLGKYHTYKNEERNPFKTGRDKNVDFGLDGKIGLSGAFTLDLTINPDFGQVEADPSQISLGSYELFYEEKRPFFIEGNNILSFANLFYPRRIGHSPSYYPSLNSNEYIKMPESTSILGALKITGKTDDGLSLGILESVTGKESADIQTASGRKSLTVEPLTNFLIARAQKEYDKGNIIFGGALTAVNRNSTEDHLNFLPTASYTGGIDFVYKWDDKNYYMGGNAIFSHVTGDKQAISRIQYSPAHYFQRPDATYLNLDTNRTTLTGYGATFEIGKGGGSWRYSESVNIYSPNLEVNDLGYLPQVDRINQATSIGYVVQTPSGVIRNYNVFWNQNSSWNYGGDNYGFSSEISSAVVFTNNWGIHAEVSRNFSAIDPALIWGGPSYKVDGAWGFEFEINSNSTEKFSTELEIENIFHDEKISKYFGIEPSINFRISDAFRISGNVFYNFTRNNLQYIDTRNSSGNNFYFLGKVEQDVVGFTARVSLYLSPDLSIQYYGSPFSATRKYSSIKKVTNPKAENYFDRYHEYRQNEISFNKESNSYFIDDNGDNKTDFVIGSPDMSFREFRSNLVLRWEYNPGSTLYFVWSQNRFNVSEYEMTSIGKAVNRVFDIYPDNIFIIKLNHWFSL